MFVGDESGSILSLRAMADGKGPFLLGGHCPRVIVRISYKDLVSVAIASSGGFLQSERNLIARSAPELRDGRFQER
jgi:hypothetical protein